jgi:hypothetical protein
MAVGVEIYGFAKRVSRAIGATAVSIALVSLHACGTGNNPGWDSADIEGGTTSSGSGSGGSSGWGGNSSGGLSSSGFISLDGSPQSESGTGSSSSSGGPPTAIWTGQAPDCMGCTFPPASAPSCSNGPAINLVYPPDTVLLPPNMNVISVQWTPYGGGYQRFSVDFSSPPNTDGHVLTSCANQTTDMQAGGSPSGGCELIVDPVSWSKLVGANRDGGPVAVTVRGTTDGSARIITGSRQSRADKGSAAKSG